MSMKNNPADIYVEPLDELTNKSIRQTILDAGDFDLDHRQIPLKINQKPKDVILVTKEFLEKLERSKNQVLGGPLRYNVYTKSRHGRFLNLPRASKKKAEGKTEREKDRLGRQLAEIQEKRK
jgi:hypothetical protein